MAVMPSIYDEWLVYRALEQLRGVVMNGTNVEHVLSYGSGAVCFVAGVLTYLGVHFPGITIDPNVAIMAGLGILGASSKSDRNAAAITKLQKVFLACALIPALLGMGSAHAQILKAPASTAGVSSCPPICSGFFVGAEIAGSGSNADIIGNGLDGSVFANGGITSFDGGYMFSNGTVYFAAKADVGYEFQSPLQLNNQTGSTAGLLATQCVQLGGSLQGIFGSTPAVNITLPLPVISPYGTMCGVEHGSLGEGWGSGAGVVFDINQNWFANVEYLYLDYGSATNGIATIHTENLVRFGINYRFAH
jgi:opacity protein-like surface antigen